MTKRIVFLTQDNMDGYVCDDDVALDTFAANGLVVETISWRADVDWSIFDAVIVRSTWDYQRHSDAFFNVLAKIEQATVLANELAVMRWNMDKHYLQEIEAQGVPIVPTEFGTALTNDRLLSLLAGDYDEYVIKPTISAGAERTYRLRPDLDDEHRATVLTGHTDSDWMWQPFLHQIVSEGEYSLFYFNGQFSHAIVKKPQTGDFRVQEEFGGQISEISPSDDLRAASDKVLATLDRQQLYARVDMVRGEQQWLLIELELIEPSLYLRKNAYASDRFAQAVLERLADS